MLHKEEAMSYIRCLSNPEGLYIWGGSDGINIDHCLKKPFASGRSILIPEKHFHQVCHEWDHGEHQWHGPCRSGQLTVAEQNVFMDTGDLVPASKAWLRQEMHRLTHGKKTRKTRYVIRLQYGKRYIMMWRVTWQYIVANVVNRNYEKFHCCWCKKRGK